MKVRLEVWYLQGRKFWGKESKLFVGKGLKVKRVFVVVAVIIGLLCGCGKEDTVNIPDSALEAGLNELTVNYRRNPIGIETKPVFSWKMEDETEGQRQTAYRIVVADSKEALELKQYIWDSGEIESDCSVAIPYEGDALQPESRYFWTVYVRDKDGKLIEAWGDDTFFETGILDNDWNGAQWICLEAETKTQYSAASEDTNYVISYNFKMETSNSGLIWGADTNCYGEYYLWAFDTRGAAVEFVSSLMKYETVLSEHRYVLDDIGMTKEDFVEKEHSVKIEVNGTHVTTWLDEVKIAEEELSVPKEIGLTGFWTDRGALYAYYDNFLVVDGEGKEIYWEDFESSEQTIFTPFYIKTVDGWLEASSGILMVPGGEEPAPMFRKDFQAENEKVIASARLYISALGICEAYINGKTVSDEYFAPGASHYGTEVYYRTYDVTELLQAGSNTLGIVLGHGRYNRAKADCGDKLALCEKLVIRYEDGSIQTVVSDDTWSVFGDGPVRRDDLFWGEYYDANREVDNWNLPGFQDEDWQNASVYPEMSELKKTAAENEPVLAVEELTYISVTEPEEGCFVYDFGQNFNGVCRISVHGEAGEVITLRFAETLNEEMMSCRDDAVGKIWTQNLYTAQNTDYYVLKGGEKETFSPQFVCRGFRYVQITGLDEALSEDDITAVVLSTGNERTGQFTCSDEKVNELYNNIYWTQLSNYVDVPTDCPQRDERLAWAGDAQVFALTGSYNANIYTFMDKFLDALRAGQKENGCVQDIAFIDYTWGGSNGWADAIIIITWTLYQQYGNVEIIEKNYDAMCAYMDYLVATSENFVRETKGYRDHNAISGSEDDVVNTAQCAYVAKLLSKMSSIIGQAENSEKYDKVFESYRKAWQDNYLNEDGSIGEWYPSDYTLGLAFGLYPEELEATGAEKLNIAVTAQDFHVSTGYVSTPFLLPVLCKYGYTDAAYQLLMQDSAPSWNAMFAHGGTTITEGWNTYLEDEDGSYHINGSLNHYGLGSVGAWFYTDILGIKRDEMSPAFKHFILEPRPGGGLTYASGSYESMYGTIESSWYVEGDEIVFQFTIPANTSATVILPEEEYEEMELEAGKYEFRVK